MGNKTKTFIMILAGLSCGLIGFWTFYFLTKPIACSLVVELNNPPNYQLICDNTWNTKPFLKEVALSEELIPWCKKHHNDKPVIVAPTAK